MMRENVAPLLEDARPEELEAGQDAERALKAIEDAVYAISDEADRQNALTANERNVIPILEGARIQRGRDERAVG